MIEEILQKEREKLAYFQGVLDTIKQTGIFYNPKAIYIEVDDECNEILTIPFTMTEENKVARFKFSLTIT